MLCALGHPESGARRSLSPAFSKDKKNHFPGNLPARPRAGAPAARCLWHVLFPRKRWGHFPRGWPAGRLCDHHLPGATDLHSLPGNHEAKTDMTGRPRATPAAESEDILRETRAPVGAGSWGGGVKALGEPPAGSGGRPSPQQGPGEAPKPQTATAATAPVFAGRQAVLCPRRAIVNDSCARELSITLP